MSFARQLPAESPEITRLLRELWHAWNAFTGAETVEGQDAAGAEYVAASKALKAARRARP